MTDPPQNVSLVPFQLPTEPFGLGQTERVIEIPWALSCIAPRDVVLDIGYANAEEEYIRGLLATPASRIQGYDFILNERKSWDPDGKIQKSVGDAREIKCYPLESFDTVICVSTIEHIGFDNSIYFSEPGFTRQPADDLRVIDELTKVTKRNGKIVLTVPFGMEVDYGWFMQYDRRRLHRLIRHSDCWVGTLEFFGYRSGGWFRAREAELENTHYKDNGAPAAAGLACVLLVKK